MRKFAEGAAVLERRGFELAPGERLLCGCIAHGGSAAWHAFGPGCQRWPRHRAEPVDVPASIRLLDRRAGAARDLADGLTTMHGASS